MTITYYVVCRRVPPRREGGWNARVGPVEVSAARRVDPDVMRAAGIGQVAAIVSFCAAADAAELSLRLALELARASGGAIVHERGPTRIADAGADRIAPVSARMVEAAWDRRLGEARWRERGEQEQQMRRWQALREADPRTDAENDWSGL